MSQVLWDYPRTIPQVVIHPGRLLLWADPFFAGVSYGNATINVSAPGLAILRLGSTCDRPLVDELVLSWSEDAMETLEEYLAENQEGQLIAMA